LQCLWVRRRDTIFSFFGQSAKAESRIQGDDFRNFSSVITSESSKDLN
jgi:hypothetical protein